MNSKMLSLGQIVNRDTNFEAPGFEYTFVLLNHEAFKARIQSMITATGMNVKMDADPKKPLMAFNGRTWSFWLYRVAHINTNVAYIGFFRQYRKWGLLLDDEDEANRLLTTIERAVVDIDPLAWIRELPSEKELLGRNPESYKAAPPITDLTRAEAADRGLKEGYLADALNSMGAHVAGGIAHAKADPSVVLNPLIIKRLEKENNPQPDSVPEASADTPAFCMECGAKLSEGDAFCSECGTTVEI